MTVALTHSTRISPILSRAVGARPDGLSAPPMRQSYSAYSHSLSSISGGQFFISAARAAVSSPRYLVSMPYIVQINSITVLRGASVKAGDEIGRVRSPQHDEIVATYMRSLADIAGRKAELRVKARVARESLDAARSHLRLAEEAVELIANSSAASLNYRIDMSRERAVANKTVVSQEAEAAEASTAVTHRPAIARYTTQF